MGYKKCPRCSLNYIQDTDVLCKICLVEVGKALRSDEDDEEEYDICPECGDHIIKAGEEMCYQCMMEQVKDEAEEQIPDKEEGWDGFHEDDGVFTEDPEQDDEELKEIELDVQEEEELHSNEELALLENPGEDEDEDEDEDY